jgi:hypothetical protein
MMFKYNILILLMLPVMVQANKGDAEFKKTIEKSFAVNNGATVEILNKYGKIVLRTWNKNEVKATIVITGYGKSTSEAEDIVGMVDVASRNSGGEVNLTTKYNPRSGGKWFSWGSKRDSKDYVKIDYEVYVPQSLSKLSIDNQFGDVIADRLPFAADMRLNYCFYDIREISGPLVMNLNYCQKGNIGKAGKVNLNANYSSVNSDRIDELTVRSNYSEYDLKSVGRIEIQANYDKYKMNEVGGISSRSNYTDFQINQLQGEAKMTLTYGNADLRALSGSFKGGDFRLSYSDIKLGIPQKLPLQLNVVLSYGDVNLGGLDLKNKNVIKKNKDLIMTGFSTNGNDQSPEIRVQGAYSSVGIRSL